MRKSASIFLWFVVDVVECVGNKMGLVFLLAAMVHPLRVMRR